MDPPHVTEDLEGGAQVFLPDEASSDAALRDAAPQNEAVDQQGDELPVEDAAYKFSTLKVLDVTLVVACRYLICFSCGFSAATCN